MELSGKVAVVTGGTRGIGRAIAAAFAASGAQVAVIHNDSEPPQYIPCSHVSGKEERIVELKGDISEADQVRHCFGQIGERCARVDILVNCAGMTERLPLMHMSEASWERTLAVNLTGHYLCTKEAVKYMSSGGGGSIINVSSVRARRGYAYDSSYIAAKGGIEAFTRAMAVELAEYRIRVNCIAPGAIETDFNRDRLQDPVIREKTIQSIPLARIGVPEDVAGIAVFLASEQSAYITGVTIPVDGGQMIKG